MTAEQLVQIGMRAAIRDVQEWLDSGHTASNAFILNENNLRAYLLAMLITAGAYEDDPDAPQWWSVDGEG